MKYHRTNKFIENRFDLNVELLEIHTIYRLRMFDITMMIIFYM
jgi:hypothetical protein